MWQNIIKSIIHIKVKYFGLSHLSWGPDNLKGASDLVAPTTKGRVNEERQGADWLAGPAKDRVNFEQVATQNGVIRQEMGVW